MHSDASHDLVQDTIPVRVVDTDVHPVPVNLDQFIEHYPEPFRSRYFGKHREEVPLSFLLYTPHSNIGSSGMSRPGGYAKPPTDGSAGSDPEFLARQLCVEHRTDYCIMNSLYFRPRHWDPEWDAAHSSAVNSWMAEHWLEGDANSHGRFFGAIQVTSMDPLAAAREIDKWAEHPAFVHAYLLADSQTAFGHPQYDPVHKVCAKYGLPLATHLFRQAGLRSITPVGFPSYHVEVLPNWIFTYVSHITSMIFEGVFERYPSLKFVAIEGGCEWLAPLMWRLDRQWEELGAEIPQCKRRPSEVILDHVRLTTQPICEPDGRRDLQRFMEWAGAERTLLFSSDYAHYDFDSAVWVSQLLPEAWRYRVMAGNALETYDKLPAERPRDYLDDMEIVNPRMDAAERRFAARELVATGAASELSVMEMIESTD